MTKLYVLETDNSGGAGAASWADSDADQPHYSLVNIFY
jgi:hypothetical protein